MAELEQDCSPSLWALPPRANLQLLQEVRKEEERAGGGDKKIPKDGPPATALALTTQHRKLSQSRADSSP